MTICSLPDSPTRLGAITEGMHPEFKKSKVRERQARRRKRDAKITSPLQRTIHELRGALEEIRKFCEDRSDLSWEERGDDFRKLAEMAKGALETDPPTRVGAEAGKPCPIAEEGPSGYSIPCTLPAGHSGYHCSGMGWRW